MFSDPRSPVFHLAGPHQAYPMMNQQPDYYPNPYPVAKRDGGSAPRPWWLPIGRGKKTSAILRVGKRANYDGN